MSSDEKEANHAPTVDRVTQVFHRSNLNPNSSELPSGAELPEIDFMDIGSFVNEIKVEAASKNDTSTSIKMAEEQTTRTVEASFMGDRIDIEPSPEQDSLTPANHVPVEHPDTHNPGEDVEDDDEIIVYVAPYPRKGTHLSSPSSSSSVAVVTIPPLADSEPVSGQVLEGTNDPPSTGSLAEPTLEHIPTPSSPNLLPALTSGDVSNATLPVSSRSVHRIRRPHLVSKRRVKRHVTFGSFGAIQAKAALREVDPQRDEQRRGDSDVDWGDSTSEGSLEDGGMLVDQDIDVHAMAAFVKGMSISESAQVTADDLEDETRILTEDEDEEKSDGESAHESANESDDTTGQYDEELKLAGETPIMLITDGDIALEDGLVESEDEDTSEEGESPKGSFQVRLRRLRERTQGRPIRDVLKDELDGELEVEEEDDSSIVGQIQVMLSQSPNVSFVTHAFSTGLPR